MEGEAAHHLGRVLRAQPGQVYELSNGEAVRLARVEKVARDRVEFALLGELPAHQPRLEVTLLLSIVKFDAFEWAIEKATELGVSTIVPLAAARSEKALLAAAAKRAERWQKVLLEASQQSRRVRIPALSELSKPESAFNARKEGLRVMLSERLGAPPLRKVLEGENAMKAALAIGPEGGWTDAELETGRKAGFMEASLGQLILRTETAVISALSSVNYAMGDG
jgi:16S rRNA (uracil1498-N3)-methyltransferase